MEDAPVGPRHVWLGAANVRVTRRPWRLVIAAAAMAILAGACGGGAAKAPVSTQPLEEQLGLANFGEAPPLAEARVIQQCMKAQGFEYVPVDPNAQKAAVGSPSSAQKRKLYGYGISTRYGQPRSPTPPDPNVAIRAALTPANQIAYDQALTGTSASSGGGGGGGGGGGNQGGSYRTVGGCTQQAVRQVYGGAQVFSSLISKLHDLNKRVDNDQRVVKANQAWSLCMQNDGFHYAKPGDIKPDLKKKLKAIVGSTSSTTVVSPGSSGAPAYDPAALAALQRQEMAISRADLACNAKTHLTKIKNAVQAEYEAAFRQQNAPLLAKVTPPKGG